MTKDRWLRKSEHPIPKAYKQLWAYHRVYGVIVVTKGLAADAWWSEDNHAVFTHWMPYSAPPPPSEE